MPLFACDRCGVIENTALSGYWTRSLRDGGTGEALCSECDKGEWHGKFPREVLTDEKIAATTDWSGWMPCKKLESVLAAYDEKMKAERVEKKRTIVLSHTSPYPDHIQQMPNGSRAQRKAKQLAKQRYATLNAQEAK